MAPEKATVITGSRLHFGLFAAESRISRSFGGLGLMVEAPALEVSVQHADTWSARGPLAERALSYARRFAEETPCSIHVETIAGAHTGLGVGTQLGLAVAKALATIGGCQETGAVQLAQRVGRGARSAIGVHGFDLGGFLVDGGKGPETCIAPLIARHPFPDDWRILLCNPGGMGVSGEAERRAFDHVQATDKQTEKLCALALRDVLPALLDRDLDTFGEALHEFNRLAGEIFSAHQEGSYASKRVADLVSFIREQGVKCVGQSSWGPTVFAIGEAETIGRVKERILSTLDVESAIVTQAMNCGARVQ